MGTNMTKYEGLKKSELKRFLASQGYLTYAKLLNATNTLNVTKDPSVIGYMVPGQSKIVINDDLDLDTAALVIRHEILHSYLQHESRLLKHLASKHDLDYDELDDIKIGDLKNELYANKLFNIAGDYEISNRGYTDADKRLIRRIVLNGQILSGLVTEDEHPDWADLSVEEMFDKLKEEQPDAPQNKDDSGDGEQDPNQQGDGDTNQNPGQQQGNGDSDSDSDSGESQDTDGKVTQGKGGSGSKQSGGTKIIQGHFINGRFYDLDGNEIKH